MRAELTQFGVWEGAQSLEDLVHQPVLVFGYDSVRLTVTRGQADVYSLGFWTG